MKLPRLRTNFARIGTILLIMTSTCRAGDDDISRLTLRGLSGISVVLEEFDDQAKRDGLNASEIQTDVELKLRLAGIRVLTEKAVNVLGMPMLYVNVNAMALSGSVSGLYAYSYGVSVHQGVLLERDRTVSTMAATWSVHGIATVGRNNFVPSVRGDIRDLVDKFLNAYLSVNPKK